MGVHCIMYTEYEFSGHIGIRVENDILKHGKNNGFQGIDERAINEGTWNKWN